MNREELYSVNNIRKQFLNFYKSKDHMVGDSASLIPKDDKSLLLIAAGMAPLKKYFTGQETPPAKRYTTCQKCIRTNDIENVGVTARHLTFFEMLGNFSFGDYFKKEAITWAWEFLTKVMEIPEEKLWVSVYEEDDEAYDIWLKETTMTADRIVKLGKEDNFWELEVGPSGPDSEIHYDMGEEFGCGDPDCKPGCDCERFTEIWNLVFTQFDKDTEGNYNPLEHPNIDTGMGLERIAMTLQGKKTVFDVEPLRSIISMVEDLSGKKYGEDAKNDTAMKVIADHTRAVTFMISDGILPSNEGRGYVLRRLLRRALRQGKLLNIEGDFINDIIATVIKLWGEAYPDLVAKTDYILKVGKIEEDKFAKTIDQGLEMLQKEIASAKEKSQNSLDSNMIFKLYDTFGFPFELTEEILIEAGFEYKRDEVEAIMEESRQKARNARGSSGNAGWKDNNLNLDVDKTDFIGYEEFESDAKVLKIFVNDEERNELLADEDGIIVLDRTPFYGESGGQVGDTGMLENDKFSALVTDTKKSNDVFLHFVTVHEGMISVGDLITAKIDIDRRKDIGKNHTATHILHYALKKVLGSHVNQAGSLVNADRLRFDYTHFESVKAEELAAIEKLANEMIMSDSEVDIKVLGLDEAKKLGAMALFDEKYGDKVRVVSVGDSMEFCGGAHIDNSSKIGMIKILSEGGVASGVRRIEAVTGRSCLAHMNELSDICSELNKDLRATNSEIVSRVEGLKLEIKDKDKEIAKLKEEILKSNMGEIMDAYEEVEGVKIFTVKLDNKDVSQVREVIDKIKDKEESCIVLVASDCKTKVLLAAAVTKDLTAKKVSAGNIVKAAAMVTGGNGGGRPDFAQAGGKDPSKIEEAFKKAKEIAKEMLS